MRLTMSLRDKIIREILADVPKVDYTTLITAHVRESCKRVLPPAIAALIDTPEEHRLNQLHMYVTNSIGQMCGVGSVYAPGVVHSDMNPVGMGTTYGVHNFFTREDCKEYNRLVGLASEQHISLQDIERELRTTLRPYSSTIKLLEDFPKFKKYIPPEPEVTQNLPMVVNTKAVDLLISSGWTPPTPPSTTNL